MSTQLNESVINDLTYDERAGCYIRFPSETDAIIASLALSQNCLSWQDLDRILRVVTNPKFDPTKITLHSAAEILQHAERSRVDEYAKKAHTRTKSSTRAAVSRRQPLPLVILDEILEIFHRERKLALESDRYYGAVYRLNDVEKGRTFAIMSLVHRSWTLPCQHALGRIVRVTDVDKFISKDRLMSSIYGPWTTSMIINAQTGSNGRLRPINTQDLEKFILRFSNIRSLWIKVGNDWSSVWWLNDFYGEILKRNHRLQVLRLHGGKGVVPKVSLQPYFDNREYLEELHTLDVHDFSDGNVEMVLIPRHRKLPCGTSRSLPPAGWIISGLRVSFPQISTARGYRPSLCWTKAGEKRLFIRHPTPSGSPRHGKHSTGLFFVLRNTTSHNGLHLCCLIVQTSASCPSMT